MQGANLTGWRVWFAFEARPGVRIDSAHDRSSHWKRLAESCRSPDGKLNVAEYERWLDLMIDHAHLWGQA